ncbi:MAG: penicillin-binding protein 2, partial [Candidatus Thiodiazotropha sp. (ex Lucinoma borealis)]|nr:penicillin-binding protein 2 [Candidatus Thiodiazotropha sp. (ex Lucinoma borealis)]
MLQSSIKDYLHESQLFLGRVVVSGTLVILVLVALVGRLFYLQVENHDHFTTLSQDNRVKLEPLPPTRGLIYDRHGTILAQNLPAYSLEIIPEKSTHLDDT